jgi:hypothetical protein
MIIPGNTCCCRWLCFTDLWYLVRATNVLSTICGTEHDRTVQLAGSPAIGANGP